jgi:hypothetical protein
MPKLSNILSAGNAAIVLSGIVAVIAQFHACLPAEWVGPADAIVVIAGLVLNTLHLEKNLKTPPPV